MCKLVTIKRKISQNEKVRKGSEGDRSLIGYYDSYEILDS